MRIEFTVVNGPAACDVAVSAPAPVPLSAFAAELARTVGAAPAAPLWGGDVPLAATALLGTAGLRTGAVLSYGGPHRAGTGSGVLALHQVGGPGAGRVAPIGRGRIVIGREPGCDLVLDDADVSRRHAVLEVAGGAITVRDTASTNGTYVDGRPVGAAGRELRPGDIVRIGDSTLSLAGPTQTPAAIAATADGTVRVLRPPRPAAPAAATEIEVPSRSSAARPRGVQWVTALLPAAAGGAIAWTTHSPQFLLFALLSPVMMLSSSLGDRLHWRRSRRREAASYRHRRSAADRAVSAALQAETIARRRHHPDPAALASLAALPGSRLWERRRADDDLLQVTIGTADLPSTVRTREGTAVASAGLVRAVPYAVELRHGPLGLAGPRERGLGMARWVVGQLAALHGPADVTISLLAPDDAVDDWGWLRWLPHGRGSTADDDEARGELVADLAALVAQRRSQHRGARDPWPGPWHVLVVDRPSRLTGLTGLGAVLDGGAAIGVTALCLDDEVAGLPTACRTVVRVAGDSGSRATVHASGRAAAGAGREEQPVVADAVSAHWADTLARNLAALVGEADDATGGVPESCGLLETLGRDPRHRHDDLPAPLRLDAPALQARWATGDGGAATTVGVCADGPLLVDLVADGPHALVAGTTGAGKSELLQSLVAGLAANHSPADVNFLLIDYKGGAAFADCAQLPHTAAMVTDLDGYLTERALRSLRSELRRREQLFAAAAAVDLAGYRRLAAEPLPRLVIVVDEFAALADELPDFVRGLVGVAQRGRSLGVHLVLATQRPGRAVSPEIRANTSLRVALRMTDGAESSEVIDAPDAATIARSCPGRAYLRAGATLTCFQTAYAGGPMPSTAAVEVERLGRWRRPAPAPPGAEGQVELSQLVAALRAVAEASRCPPARRPWLPPLPEGLPRSALPARPVTAPPGTVTLGLIDQPDEQRQPGLTLDLTAGPSVLVAGTARSGRTSTLVSLLAGAVEQFGPDRLGVYVIDAGGALSTAVHDLPHCATVLGPDELGSAPLLLRRLERLCAGAGGSDQVPSAPQLLLIDGWDALVAGRPDAEAVECADTLANLVRSGAAGGLATVITGDRAVLAPRLAAGFGHKIVLGLADRNDYGLAGIPPRSVPPTMPAGRALCGPDGALVQIAHAGSSPDLAGAARGLREAAARGASRGVGPRPDAIRLRPLPGHVSLSALPRGSATATSRRRMVLGVAGDRAEPVHVDLFAGAGRVLIAGPPRSGRSTVLRSLLAQAVAGGVYTVVAAGPRSPLRGLAAELSVRVLDVAHADPAIASTPRSPTLLLVDDCESLVDTAAGDALTEWVRTADAALAAVVAGRADDLATTYRGLGAQVRRANCGLLLRPGPVDGEILGVRLPRRPSGGPPGRGVLVGDPAWGAAFDDGEPLPIQVAQP